MDLKKIRNPFEQELVDNGYKIFKSSFNNSLRGFQKKYTDKKGIKYFINFWHYNHGEQIPNSSAPNKDTYYANAQLNLDNPQENTIDLDFSGSFTESIHIETTTLEEVEDFYEQFFVNFKCKYYETYEY